MALKMLNVHLSAQAMSGVVLRLIVLRMNSAWVIFENSCMWSSQCISYRDSHALLSGQFTVMFFYVYLSEFKQLLLKEVHMFTSF